MTIQQNMHFQSGLLSVDASGEFSLEDAKQAFLEMLEAVAQYKAEKILLDGQNVILNTPTGSGKSLVASAMLFSALARGERAVYTCPI